MTEGLVRRTRGKSVRDRGEETVWKRKGQHAGTDMDEHCEEFSKTARGAKTNDQLWSTTCLFGKPSPYVTDSCTPVDRCCSLARLSEHEKTARKTVYTAPLNQDYIPFLQANPAASSPWVMQRRLADLHQAHALPRAPLVHRRRH